jgi:hypothetical protein
MRKEKNYGPFNMKSINESQNKLLSNAGNNIDKQIKILGKITNEEHKRVELKDRRPHTVTLTGRED